MVPSYAPDGQGRTALTPPARRSSPALTVAVAPSARPVANTWGESPASAASPLVPGDSTGASPWDRRHGRPEGPAARRRGPEDLPRPGRSPDGLSSVGRADRRPLTTPWRRGPTHGSDHPDHDSTERQHHGRRSLRGARHGHRRTSRSGSGSLGRRHGSRAAPRLSGVTFCDSPGADLFVRVHRHPRRRACDFTCALCRAIVRRCSACSAWTKPSPAPSPDHRPLRGVPAPVVRKTGPPERSVRPCRRSTPSGTLTVTAASCFEARSGSKGWA